MRSLRAIPIALWAIAASLGCAVAADETTSTAAGGNDFQYVVSGLQLPGSASEADDMGFDLDGDPSAKPDNQLGVILSQLFTSNIADMNEEVDALIASGAILHLIELSARSLEGRQSASLSMYVGHDTDSNPDDNFSGAETFVLEPSDGERLPGFLNNGKLEVGPGTLAVKLALPGGQTPFLIDLVAAHVTADVGPQAIEGRIGGAVTKADVDERLVPFTHQAITRLIDMYCTPKLGQDQPECEPGSTGEFFLDLLDTDMDGTVTLGELRSHPLVESLLKPDVDLFDADGSYAPGVDGVADSLSFAIGIEAVQAAF